MTAPATARKEDVKRAVAGVLAGGMNIGRVTIMPNGAIVIESAAAVEQPGRVNPLDRVLGNR